MAEVLNKKMIRRIFRNAHKHRRIGEIIRRFSTNKEDIRKKALDKIDLSGCLNVLEPGCAFGAFTEALKGKLHPEAKITGLDILPEYEQFFLEACARAGYAGRFSAGGVEQIIAYPARSFDLIICSYALYFFPALIKDIVRILKTEGTFITITHSECDMRELVEITKNVLGKNKMLAANQTLPIENIVGEFSAENGEGMLGDFFANVRSVDFKNTLIFPLAEIDYLLEYFHFKKSFFLTETQPGKQEIIEQILREIKNSARKNNSVSMCKDDRIFIASRPRAAKERL